MNEKLQTYEEKMKKTMANLDSELATIRAGRANPNVLNKIMVDYYGSPTNPAGGERFCSGAADDPDSAMGEKHGESDREGYPDL